MTSNILQEILNFSKLGVLIFKLEIYATLMNNLIM